MNETLWITGASGFTGSRLVAFVGGLPNRPRLVGLNAAAPGPAGVDAHFNLDVQDADAVAAVASREPPRWVIHLAGVMPPVPAEAMWSANVGGTLGLMLGLRAARVRHARVVSVGSAAEYAPSSSTSARVETSECGGASPYGNTKWAQTLVALGAARGGDIEPLVARTFNLIGPGLATRLVLGSLCEQFSRDPAPDEIVLGNPDAARDFVDVRDAVEAYWQVARGGNAGEVYNVCSGRPATVREILGILGQLTGRAPRIQSDPSRLRPSDPPVVWGTPAKITGVTGWKPRLSLEQSLRDMIEWHRARR